MARKNRFKLVASAGAALAVAGGGAALAAGELSPRQESSAVLDDAAEELGIDSTKLADALEHALENRVDEAVEAGRLTQEQGEELKARIASGEVPLLGLRGGGPGFGHHGHGARLDAAASFLGLTEAELREQLRDGKTLAEIAKAEGKTVAALVDALVAAAKAELAEAVENGRLTDAQRDRIVEELEERITAGVNATPGRHFRGGPRLRGGPGFRGGPDAAPPAGEPGSWFGGGTEPPAAA
jgi:hypothetical protein